MTTYNIEKPKTLTSERVGYILARVVFPPIILWDLLKKGVSKRWSAKIGTFIFQASHINFSEYGLPKDWKKNAGQLLQTQPNISHEFHTVKTHDGAELDTLDIIHNSQKSKPIQAQKFVIYFNGNAAHYAVAAEKDLLKNVHEDKYNQVCFNFRGTDQQGEAPNVAKDLVTDGIAQVQRLLNQGVLAENIILRGQSLGGAIAAKVGQHFHQHKSPVRVYNERSFSTLTKFVVGYVRRISIKDKALKPEETFGGKVMGYLAYPFVSLVLHLTSWEINAAKAFKSIPKKDRDYVVIRTLKAKRTLAHTDDNVIPHYASMHKALSGDRRGIKRKLEVLQKNPLDNLEEIKQLKRQLKGVKMETTPTTTNAHNVETRNGNVKNIFNQTMEDRFKMFTNKAFNPVDPSAAKPKLAPGLK